MIWKTSWRRIKKRSSRLPFVTNLRRLLDQNSDIFTTSLRRHCVAWVSRKSLLFLLDFFTNLQALNDVNISTTLYDSFCTTCCIFSVWFVLEVSQVYSNSNFF